MSKVKIIITQLVQCITDSDAGMVERCSIEAYMG